MTQIAFSRAHNSDARQVQPWMPVARFAGFVLLALGVMGLLAGVAMLINPKLLGGAAASAWADLCGQPAGRPSTSLLLAGIGAGAAVLGTALATLGSVRRMLMLMVAVAVALAGAGLGYATGRISLAADAPPPSGKFALLNPPRIANNFILRNTLGGMTELRDFQGKTTLLFFGYTHCPDVCPTTLSDYKLLKRALGADAAKVNFVFISVDGERDTPEFLKRYLAVFDQDFVALVAHPAVVRSVLADFGGTFRTEPIPNSDSYKVLHTADTYLIDAQGRWQAVMPLGTPRDTMLQTIRSAIK